MMKQTRAPQALNAPSLWLALSLALSVAISNGLARFAYGLILPSMREDLSWSYSVAGFLNSANAVGYMLGAFAGYAWLRRVDPVKLFRIGLVLTVVTLCATPLSEKLAFLSIMRGLTGLGAAWVFACGAAIVSFIFSEDPHRRGIAVGIYFSGAGIGMIATGLALPPLFEFAGASSWRFSWYLIGGASAMFAIFPFFTAARANVSTSSVEVSSTWSVRAYLMPMAAFILFGASTNVYLTFLAAWITERGQHWYQISLAWSILGLGVCLSPFIWRKALNLWPATRTLSCALLVSALGVALSFTGGNEAVMLVSALLYGSALFIAPTAVTILARTTRPSSDWANFVALFTLMFSVGQTLGPWAAGAVSDVYGLAYAMGSVLIVLVVAGMLANGPSEARRLAREYSERQAT